MTKMTKAAWIRLLVLLLILAGILAAAWYFYVEIRDRDNYDEFGWGEISYGHLSLYLEDYEILRLHPEFESFKARYSPDGLLDRAIQSLRDLKESLSDNPQEWAETSDDTEFDLLSLYVFVNDFLRHIRITNEQIIGIENLTENELQFVIQEERSSQQMALRTVYSIYTGEESLHPFVQGFYDLKSEDAVITEIIQTDKYFDAEKREYVYHFWIQSEDGRGLVIGEMSGTEWVYIIHQNINAYKHFLPADFERIDSIAQPFNEPNGMSDLVNACISYTAYMNAVNPSIHLSDLLHALGFLYQELNDVEFIFTPDDFRERALYVFGIIGIEDEGIFRISWNEERVSVPNEHRSHIWLLAELVSEEISEDFDSAVIVINYYGQGFYFELAKTIQYELEMGEKGWRLVSTEYLYESGDVEITARRW
jgi:hypothetical protein